MFKVLCGIRVEYNEKYSIHYLCEEWMGKLLDLLENSGDKSAYAEVMKCCRKMGTNSCRQH